MNHDIEEAITVTVDAYEKICKLIDHFADTEEPDTESIEKAQSLYQLAAHLQVKASQLTDSTKVYEGHCHVNNARATVQIGGYEIRGHIAFEIQKDGRWIRGHRENSPYGQVFIGADGVPAILTEEITGRITHPLQMDEK